MAVAAYIRVSSASQNLETQKAAIVQAARARKTPVRAWYAEKVSGRTVARPVLEQLRADVRAGRVSRLFVYRLDRLTRSGIRDTLALVDEFRAAGVELVTLADGFDVAGPAADVVLAVLAWAASMERLAIGERIQAARARIEEQGGAWGRPSRMTLGERKQARKMRANGSSVREIAIAMKVPKSTVQRAVCS